MRCCFLNINLQGGGAERQLVQLVRYWRQAGWDLEVVLLERQGVWLDAAAADAPCHWLSEQLPSGSVAKIFWAHRMVPRVRQFLVEHQFDAVLTFLWLPTLLAALALRKQSARPLGRKLGLSGRSAGMFLAQDYWRRGKLGWGYHATIIGESYLNFGLVAVFIIGIFYGIWLRTVASLLRNLKSPVALSVAALLAVYSLRVFYESSAKVFETFVVLGFLLAVVAIFSLFPVKSILPRSELRFSGSSSASKNSFLG